VPKRYLRSVLSLLATLALALLIAAPAMAEKGGEGLYGKTDDKVITNFGFGLMIFFTVLVVGLSIGQYLLEKRKQRK
jgi:Ni/Fe-hydrogenase subunit HybB-like protein